MLYVNYISIISKIKIIYLFLIFIIIQLQLSAFYPHPSTPPQPNPSPFPTAALVLDFGHVSFIIVPYNPSTHCHLPTPLWLLSVCSLIQCLWFYFAHLFVLLIRFHLQVRSYGICLLPPGLFHLALCSPVPSMLS